MLRVLLLSALLASSYARHVRIINGTDADDGEFPFAAVLRLNGNLNCGSTILNEKFILTAAHCLCLSFTPVESVSFQYGYTTLPGTNSRVAQAVDFQCHPNFDFPAYDVAVVELAEALPQDGTWERVTIAEEFDASVEHLGTIIGWGTINSDTGALADTLQKLNVTTYTDRFCSTWAETDEDICVGSDTGSTCFGDSGTALLVDGIQVGVTSWVTDGACTPSGQGAPNGYTRIPTYLDFILEVAGDVNVARK